MNDWTDNIKTVADVHIGIQNDDQICIRFATVPYSSVDQDLHLLEKKKLYNFSKSSDRCYLLHAPHLVKRSALIMAITQMLGTHGLSVSTEDLET